VITSLPISTNDAGVLLPANPSPDALKPAATYLASLRSDVGRRNMASTLNRVSRIVTRNPDATWQDMNWLTLDAANVQAIIAQMDGAPATVNMTLAALRGVARSAYLAGLMDVDTYQRIRLVKGAKGSREAAGRDVEAWEIAALMRTCAKDKSAAGARDAAMIAMAAKTGARREELADIKLAEMTRTADGCEIRVIGKGNKERILFIDNGAWRALHDWLTIRGDAGQYLFVQITQRGSVLPDTSLSTTAMHKILVKRSAEAGVKDLGWHDFRRTVAGELLNVGEDISTVAQILGHADVRTTARYDRRPAEARRKAARKISVPYFGR
jgi:integrase